MGTREAAVISVVQGHLGPGFFARDEEGGHMTAHCLDVLSRNTLKKKKKKHSGWLYDSDLLTILYNLDILYILYFIENLFLIRRLPLCGQRWDLVKITFPQTVL